MSTADDGRLMRLATYASVATAATLILAKLAAWAMTGSVALLSTLIDSALDAAASLVNLWAVRHALTPADHDHRFGHGKAEALAGLGQSAFIAGSGGLLVVEAASRVFHPAPVANEAVGIGVMVFSSLLTLLLIRFQRMVTERTDSLAITADAAHYTGDLMINASVVVSLLLSSLLGWTFADPLFAIAIAAYLLWSGWHIALASFDTLMDRELPLADRERITAIVRSHPMVQDLHDLRTRTSGLHGFVQLHLELDGTLTLSRAHDIADQVEASINEAFPKLEVIIHQDPAGLRESHPCVE